MLNGADFFVFLIVLNCTIPIALQKPLEMCILNWKDLFLLFGASAPLALVFDLLTSLDPS